MKVWYSAEPDTFKFSNKHKYEYIFFKYGIILSKTTKEKQEIEVYNLKKDMVEVGKGYIRKSNYYKLQWKFPFYKLESTLTQTILG